MRCQRDGCPGEIRDGYCDDCGMAPRPAAAPGTGTSGRTWQQPGTSGSQPLRDRRAGHRHIRHRGPGRLRRRASPSWAPPSIGSASSSRSGTVVSRPRRLGVGLVEIPRVPARDPATAVMAEPQVAEQRRFCGECNEPVGPQPGRRRPAARRGSAGAAATRSRSWPSCRPALLVAGQYEVVGLPRPRRAGLDLPRSRPQRGRPVGRAEGAAQHRRRATPWPPRSPSAGSWPRSSTRTSSRSTTSSSTTATATSSWSTSTASACGASSRPGGPPTADRPDPLPVDQAIAYVLEILPALGHLHDLGLLFCDFKPDNVIQTPDSVKLIDLGGVYRMDDRTSPVYGTVGYQAPEIARTGPTVPSDLFTVGPHARWCCAPTSAGYQSTYQYTLPPAARRAALRRGTTRCTASCERATAPDPDDRFQSADEMAAQLRRRPARGRGDQHRRARARREHAASPARRDGRRRGPTGGPCPSRSSTPTTRAPAWCRRSAPWDPRRCSRPSRPYPTPASRSTFDEHVPSSSWGGSTTRPPCSTRWRPRWPDPTSAPTGECRGTGGWWPWPRRTATRASRCFEVVYRHLPGELAPRLALAYAAEASGDLHAATAWYDIVSRIDPGYTRPPSAWPAPAWPWTTDPAPSRPTGGSRTARAPTRRPGSRRWQRCSTGTATAARGDARRPTSGDDRRRARTRGRAAVPAHGRRPRGGLRSTPPRRNLRRSVDADPRAPVHRPRPPARTRADLPGGGAPRRHRHRANRPRRPRQPHPAEVVVVSRRTLLCCPACGSGALADDEFCEACGAAIAEPRDAPRHHVEVDLGWVAAVSDRGLRHHRNEDAFHVEAHGGSAVLVVCDGVSASTAPQIAAQVAAEVAGRSMSAGLGGTGSDGRQPSRVVTDALAEAAAGRVAACRGCSVPERDAPSCTVVAALWDGVDVTVGWAGDSRAYWLDPSGCRRLTIDHSWAEEQVRAGRLSRAAAEADGRAHAITRWLGADAVPQDVPACRPCARTDAGHLVAVHRRALELPAARRRPGARDDDRSRRRVAGGGSPDSGPARAGQRRTRQRDGRRRRHRPRPRATPARPVERGS